MASASNCQFRARPSAARGLLRLLLSVRECGLGVHPLLSAMQDQSPMVLASAAPKVASWSLSAGKRLFDITCAILVVTAAAPLMAVLALCVKATSPGPFLFGQNRAGRNG